MIPRHFPRMVAAELRVVFGRASGRLALALALVVGVLAVALMYGAHEYGGNAQANGMPVSSLVSYSATECASWALRGRNFFVLPLVLLLCGASALGGELGDHTARELLVRPVSRASVVLAKLTALAVLSLATLVITFLPALAGGGLFFGFTPDLLPPLLLGYLASWGRDLGLLSLAFLCSTFFTNVGTSVVVVALFLMADLGARLLLKLAGMMGMASAESVAQFLPGAALDAWEHWETGWMWQPLVALLVLTVVAIVATIARVDRMDVA
jgi:ABC-type transport system involved in multi-copper enzyme maturation permease subunit